MGQYYLPVNIDKGKHLDPFEFDSGMKLMESSWLRNPMVTYVMKRLSEDWKGDRIVWAGDYGDSGLFTLHENNLYNVALTNYDKVTPVKLKGSYVDNFNKEYTIILNLNKMEYVDTMKCPNVNGWIIHPLPLLVADGNGRGGGDYWPYSEHDENYVGSWAGDRISVLKLGENMSGYKEIFPNFKEEY